MNAIELADEFKEENNDWNEDNLRHWGKQTEAMLRQQQVDLKIADDYSYILERKLKEAQAEIEALKAGKIRAYDNGVEDGRKPDTNNEPVAWRTHYPSGWEYKDGNPPFELKGNSQLLYTHPVELTDEKFDNIFANGKRLGVLETEDRFRKAMNLTDEEIISIGEQYWNGAPFKFVDFARAVLRKAQK